ncbi:MAG: type II toxin-antitoxin system Phd/YefM family antitoxin [Telmatospirillum sp.]|nr:type II toxin-antitoxin system Phd/YefM family antitoxin [Telmatospirillum sp.]
MMKKAIFCLDSTGIARRRALACKDRKTAVVVRYLREPPFGYPLLSARTRCLNCVAQWPIVVTCNHLLEARFMMIINLKDAKAGFSSLVDEAIKGEFVTITRHGKAVAALVSVEAAEIARKTMERKRGGFVKYLRTFPGEVFERNAAPSRDVDL